jgi:tripartite-type tricarboxylate transporter receptor subunit TctC
MQKLMLVASLVTAAMVCSAGSAQSYPSRPVRLVLGFAPGGAPDSVARVLSQQLTAQMGQSFVLDNRPGANGIIGADLVAKGAPDGYTLLVTSASFAVNPAIYRKLPFDPVRDFAPVTNICTSEALILAVNPSSPAQSVQELIALAKKPGSRYAYGSSGIGNVLHLAGALFNARAGTNMVHVPYKGGGPLMSALMGGEIQMMFANAATILPQIQAGKLRAIAYNNPTRASFLPDVPTMIEAGVSGMEMDSSWYGVFAPPKTSAPIVDRLQREIRAALGTAQVRERLAALGLEPVGNTPAQFGAFIAGAIRRSAELVRLAGIERE